MGRNNDNIWSISSCQHRKKLPTQNHIDTDTKYIKPLKYVFNKLYIYVKLSLNWLYDSLFN